MQLEKCIEMVFLLTECWRLQEINSNDSQELIWRVNWGEIGRKRNEERTQRHQMGGAIAAFSLSGLGHLPQNEISRVCKTEFQQ